MITDGTAVFQVVDKSEPFPAGWLTWQDTLHSRAVKANGATVLRADYPALVKYATDNNLWTSDSTKTLMYGVGDGTTTMVLPNWIDRVPQGVGTFSGTPISAGLPNIDGSFKALVYSNSSITSGAFASDTATTNLVSGGSFCSYPNIIINASRSNSIYGNSTTVQPPAGGLIPQIYY